VIPKDFKNGVSYINYASFMFFFPLLAVYNGRYWSMGCLMIYKKELKMSLFVSASVGLE